jgi:hypothetical protein
MGFALQWAAVKNVNLESICSVFKLRPTEGREEFPESDIVGAELPSGWSLIVFQRNVISDRHLKELSTLGEVVTCFVEDHVMFSMASAWKEGIQLWSVTHDCEKGKFHLESGGSAPSTLNGIQQRLSAQQKEQGGEQAEVDFLYDAPAELAKEIVGFRHDQEVEGATGSIFKVLEKDPSAPRPSLMAAFKNLFGKKGRTQ